jgi:hypothetical protein
MASDVTLVVLRPGVRAHGQDISPGYPIVTDDKELAAELVRKGLASVVRTPAPRAGDAK